MALSTYASLKAALPSWMLENTSTAVTARLDDFFTLARTRIFYGCAEPGYESQPLRIRFMETDADLTINGTDIGLPTGFLQQRRLYVNGSPKPVPDFLPPAQFRDAFQYNNEVGYPRYFTVEGEKLIIGPTPDAEYGAKLLYYKIPAALANDADTDWLMQNAPNAYLFAAVAEFACWDGDDEQYSKYSKRLAGAVNSLIFANDKDRWSAAKMAIRPNTLIV